MARTPVGWSGGGAARVRWWATAIHIRDTLFKGLTSSHDRQPAAGLLGGWEERRKATADHLAEWVVICQIGHRHAMERDIRLAGARARDLKRELR